MSRSCCHYFSSREPLLTPADELNDGPGAGKEMEREVVAGDRRVDESRFSQSEKRENGQIKRQLVY